MRLLSTKLSRWKVGDLFFLLYCLFFMTDIVFSSFLSDEICPELCTCTKPVGVVNCANKNLKEIPKDLPTWVKQLSLQDNKLSAHGLLKFNFSRFPHLEELDLSENKLQNLTLDLTDNQNLRKIFLNHCSLSTLPNIKTDANITHLSLSHNSITELGDILQNYEELFVLDLSFNKLRQIRQDDFLNKKHLTHLYLQKNRINLLPLIRFQGLDSIEVIDLSRNRIKNITRASQLQPANKQERCTGVLLTLKHLNLSQNQLTQIVGLTFSEMCSLETLTLDRNKINDLGAGAFYGPTALKSLVLDYNFINVVKRAWLFKLSSLQTLSISHNNMSRIEPDGWDFCKELIHLDLSYNRLPSLTSHGFSKLGNLETLQLSYNKISVLADFAFDGLGMLTSLDLSYNQISSSIEDINGAFLGLDSITDLSLRQNKIRSLSASALEGLESIVTLDLCNNAVTSIQNHTFDNMKNLKKLSFVSSSFLCDCQLAWFPSWLLEKKMTEEDFVYTVEGSCFHPPVLKGRDILNIESSEFICVDHPIPILIEVPVSQTALVGTNITFECRASATYTSNENSTTIMPTILPEIEKPVTEFVDLPPKPRRPGGFPLKADADKEPIVVPPQPSKTPPQRRDTERVLDVKHNMLVTWKRGQEIIQPGSGIEIRNIPRQQGAYVFMTSVLVLNGVTDADNGKYNCIISNNYGHARSTPVKLTVNEAPKFTKIPVNVTVVKNGSTAIIDCGATGQPSPLITWQKNGGKSFPAAKQRRLLREQKNIRKTQETPEEADTDTSKGGSFLKSGLMDDVKTDKDETFAVDTDAPLEFGVVLPEDSGEYECVAQSSVGRIVAKAMLIVEYAPYFTKPVSRSSKAIVGGSAVLQCMAAANPKPEITWKYNDKELNRTSRHFMAAEDQILIIVNATMNDAGAYSCYVSNKDGQINGRTELEVSQSAGGILGEIFGNHTKTAIIATVVFVCIILIFIVWLIIFCYKKKEQEKAPSTSTDATDLPPGLDGNSYASTDESLRKCHSTHDVHLTEDESNGTLLNNRYGSSRYQGSASSPDISHMQITQCTTPGSMNSTPRYPPDSRFRQIPRRSQSSMTIKDHRPLLPSFSSSENCRGGDQHALCNGNLSTGRRKGKPQPIISPSKSFARKAAGADTYVPVQLRSPKKDVSIQDTAPEHCPKSKRLKKTKGNSREKEQTPSTQSAKNCNKGVCSNNRGEFTPNSHSEQIFKQPLLSHNKQNGNLVKSRNHDSAKTEKSWRTRRKGNSTSSAETIPLGDTVGSSRKLRNSTDESQPKISSSSGAAEFSSSTTLTSESSQLLHHNKTPLHNGPPSGVESVPLLT